MLKSTLASCAICLAFFATMTIAAEIQVITPETKPAILGKEVDWIFGDYLMKNDVISLTIAKPSATRDANMTIRNIGGSILDLSLNRPSNDQLSAYIPTAARYLFRDLNKVKTGRNGNTAFWQCNSSRSPADDGTTATIRYQLSDGDAFVESTILIEGENADSVRPFDGVRADGWFEFGRTDRTAYCEDYFFRQTIGFMSPSSTRPPEWKKGRPNRLQYPDGLVERAKGRMKWTVLIYPATSPIDLISVAEKPNLSPVMHSFRVVPKSKPRKGFDSVSRAKIALKSVGQEKVDAEQSIEIHTDDEGVANARLIPGRYIAVASATGHESAEMEFEAKRAGNVVTIPLDAASGFEAEVKDDRGNPIPVKATIYSLDGNHPDFGLSSARTFVRNCVYSVHGLMHCPLDPGQYEIYFSRGPEYNVESRQLEIVAGRMTQIDVRLDRVVDTTGWISADLHSHSSPSGDNTSDQYGRVENLLCEHVEFAPCTEHNRVSSYAPHLEVMKLSHLMATCTGIELTGSPTPVNHQNAFPLHHHPHTQNGGGPRPSFNPVVQIERLAMWDEASEKLVQMNHPNLRQIYGDADVDGVPDKGFREMLRWTDVVEVHPLEAIFQDVTKTTSGRRRRIALLQWLQLLNQGHRIPGVINTDSHYNHHGSGWRRNWFACSTDDPARITTEEMVREIEAGHIVMSNGPFLSVKGVATNGSNSAIPGDDLVAKGGKVLFKVRVQCPNWVDVSRVQLFVNGRPSKKHNFTRKDSPDLFGKPDAVLKFNASLNLTLDNDAHVVVATIGEEMTMVNVMGARNGRRPPIAVSNPIFVDVDGNGFQHNGDDLDLPLPKAAN